MKGYTLPVFACASSLAALQHLHKNESVKTVQLDLIRPAETAEIPIEQVAKIGENTALAITLSDPGENLDLTRNTPIWAVVERHLEGGAGVVLKGGEGIGKQIDRDGEAAIYRYAKTLITENLQRKLHPNEGVTVTIILPEGRQLADRTSNSAFGVIEGLSLLGTTGISEPLTVPEQLEAYKESLAAKAAKFDPLVFCLGENGLHLAKSLGVPPQQLVKTANWLGPMLVAAAEFGVQSLLLFGYHGKLLKLAGGIFHTHHHLADGRLEILTAHCVKVGVESKISQQILTCATTEDALHLLRDQTPQKVQSVYTSLAETIDQRSQDYIRKHSDHGVLVGSVLFDRDRKIIIKSVNGTALLDKMC